MRGWINYYGAFYRSELYSLAKRIDEHLVRWAMQKFKRLRGKPDQGAGPGLMAVRQRQPRLFAHWHLLAAPPPVDLWGPDDGRPSRPVLREREGEIPPATHPRRRAQDAIAEIHHFGTYPVLSVGARG